MIFQSRRPKAAELFVTALLFILVLVYRLPQTVKVVFDWDHVQYLLALTRFDPAAHQPHPPGYPLFVFLSWVAALLTGDREFGLAITTISLYGAGCVCVFLFARRLFDTATGIGAALFFAVSPLAGFFLTFPNTFSVEAALASFLWLVFSEWLNETGPARASGLPWALGILSGFRPSFLAFALLPSAYLVIVRRRALWLRLSLQLVLAVLIWLVPLVALSGGTTRYLLALQAESAPFIRPLSASNLLYNVDQIHKTAFGMLGWFASLPVIYGLASAILLATSGHRAPSRLTHFAMVAALWTVPPLFFFIKNFTHPGYLCLFLPLMSIGLARCVIWIARTVCLSREPASRILGYLLTSLACATLIYHWTGSNGEFFSIRSVRNSEKRVASFVSEMQQEFPPDRTAIVSMEHFRQVQWYLPEAWAIFPQAAYARDFGTDPDRTNLYVAHNGETYPREWHFRRTGPIQPIILPPEVTHIVVSPSDFAKLGNPGGFIEGHTSEGEQYFWKTLTTHAAIAIDGETWVIAEVKPDR